MNTANRVIIALTVLLSFSSCEKYNYTDPLQGLGARVEDLEKKAFDINKGLEDLQELVTIIQNRGFLTDVKDNGDGTWTLTSYDKSTITIREGKQGQDGVDGRDGKEIDFTISAAEAPDGVWYWTINGEWLLDRKSVV